MHTQNTKTRVTQYIEQEKELTYNKLQYLGQEKKQIHNSNLMPVIKELEKEGKIEIIEQEMNKKIYRVVKWK